MLTKHTSGKSHVQMGLVFKTQVCKSLLLQTSVKFIINSQRWLPVAEHIKLKALTSDFRILLPNPGSLEIPASKYISATPLLRTLLHILRQFQSEWHVFAGIVEFVLRCFMYEMQWFIII